MADGNVGSIWYTVEAKTEKLLNSIKPAEDSVDQLGKSFSRTDKSAKKTELTMTKTAVAVKGISSSSKAAADQMKFLIDMLKVVVSMQTATALIRMADSYNEMTERVRMATRAGVDLNKVNDRLLETANRTYRPLQEAAEVYIRAGSALAAMGKSTSDTLDITDSLSFAFVKNATSADRADSAINAFTQSVNTGKVNAQNWNTILAATPTIVEDIAKATGKSEAEIRKLGVTGKLTAAQLVNSLQKSLESNRDAADNMATTAGDAMQAVRNSLMVYVGRVNQATGVTGDLASRIEDVAKAINDISVSQLVREFDAFSATVETLDRRITEFFKGMDTSAEWVKGSVSQSFSELALNTAKEVDGITNFFRGSAAALDVMYDVLTDNIENYFTNAWNKIKGGAAGFVNELADMLNKPLKALGLDGFGKVDFGVEPMKEIKKVGAEMQKAWDEAANSAGFYDDILKGLTDRQIYRSIAEWQKEYSESTEEAAAETVNLTDESDKLTTGQNKAQTAIAANAQALQDLKTALRLAALSGEELFIEQNKLRLNEYATPAQIAELEALSQVLYKVREAEQQRQKFGEGKKADEYIMGKTDPLSGGAFDDQYARYEAEAEAEQKRYNDQLDRLREARELQIETNRSYDQLEQEAAQQHADRMAQIDQAKAQVMLSSASSAFGAVADVMKQSQGEQSAIYKAMFAASKAFAIAEAIVKIQQGIANAAALPFPANIPAMAQVAAATAGIVSTISSASMGGGRQYGGPVSTGKMYRINENGAPEVYNAANGQQFLLPNSRGKVVSNKDAAGGGGGSAPKITVNLIEDSSRGGQVEQSVGQDNEQVITAFVVDIRGGGKAANALESTYGLRRVGR